MSFCVPFPNVNFVIGYKNERCLFQWWWILKPLVLNDNGDENGNDFNCKCGGPPAVDGISSWSNVPSRKMCPWHETNDKASGDDDEGAWTAVYQLNGCDKMCGMTYHQNPTLTKPCHSGAYRLIMSGGNCVVLSSAKIRTNERASSPYAPTISHQVRIWMVWLAI